jgi:hypothetical protein
MLFNLVGCHFYMLQVQFASRVKLWRHARQSSSNKVPFAPKHDRMDCFVLGARTCLSHVFRRVCVRLKKLIFRSKYFLLNMYTGHNWWTSTSNSKTDCLHNTQIVFGSSGPTLSTFAITKTVIIRSGPFLFVSSPGNASCFRWRG